eukprot:m.824179 g.824179  ORF g.824179 m.824179 type:complete len:1032 (+) comp59405_c0_seq1:154-3249(+)
MDKYFEAQPDRGRMESSELSSSARAQAGQRSRQIGLGADSQPPLARSLSSSRQASGHHAAPSLHTSSAHFASSTHSFHSMARSMGPFDASNPRNRDDERSVRFADDFPSTQSRFTEAPSFPPDINDYASRPSLAGREDLPSDQPTSDGTVARELQDLEVVIERRMKTAEATSRALREARETVNVELMLAQAQAEADAWTKGKSKLASSKLVSNLSPLGVQAVVAERNELRFQLRKAADELRKVTIASGGEDFDVVRMCQQDMERLAYIRGLVELDRDKLAIKNSTLSNALEENKQSQQQLEQQIETAREQLVERGEAVVKLNEQVRKLSEQVKQTEKNGQDTLDRSLRDLRQQLTSDAERDRRSALQTLETRMQRDQERALEHVRTELESRFTGQLQTQLSEQRHTLLIQAEQSKADELQTMQDDMHRQQQANLEDLEQRMNNEKERLVNALKQQHATVLQRMQEELESIRRRDGVATERALEDQKKVLMADHRAAMTAAKDELEAALKRHYEREAETQRVKLQQELGKDSAKKLKEELDKQKRLLEDKHAKEKAQALETLRQDLVYEKTREIESLKGTLVKRHTKTLETRTKEEVEEERARAAREAARDKAQAMERLMTELKAEKAKEFDALKERYERKLQAETDRLNQELAAARSDRALAKRDLIDQSTFVCIHFFCLHELCHTFSRNFTRSPCGILSPCGISHVCEFRYDRARSAATKQSYDQLRDRLRQLQNSVKSIVTQLEESIEASTSFQQLNGLVAALASFPPALVPLGQPSTLAAEAPEITVDVLFTAAEELSQYALHLLQKVEFMHQQFHQEKIRTRKQLDDEYTHNLQVDVLDAKSAFQRQVDAEVQNVRRALAAERDAELARDRKLYREQYEEDVAKLEAHFRDLRTQLDDEKAEFRVLQQQESVAAKRQDALQTERSLLQAKYVQEKAAKEKLQSMLTKQQEEIRKADDLQRTLRQSESTVSASRTSPQKSGELQSENAQLRRVITAQARKHLQDEKSISSLSAQLHQHAVVCLGTKSQ